MSLNGSLLIGRSALSASQAAIRVAGNNLANASTPGYSRQTIELSPLRPERLGSNGFVGTGVAIGSITRQIDVALQSRLRDAISQEQGAAIDERFLGAVETIRNELTDGDLSSQLSAFFNAWSELGNAPNDAALRSVVVQQGIGLADSLQWMRTELGSLREEVDRSLEVSVERVNGLLNEIASLNENITQTEQGVGEASGLRDRRDVLIDELSMFVDVSVVEQSSGATDILVDSIPLVLGQVSRGMEARVAPQDGGLDFSIRVAQDGTQLGVRSGTIAALLNQRDATIQPTIERLDELAGQLILSVNSLHAQGQGSTPLESVTGSYGVADTTAPLASAVADLPFAMRNGSFQLHVTQTETGVRSVHQISVNPTTDSLQDVVDRINLTIGVPNITASITADGALALDASPGHAISFSDDTGGILGALGVNGYFTGTDASDIAVDEAVERDPMRIAAGAAHIPGSNGNALALADLQDKPIDALAGRTLREAWQADVNEHAVRTATARQSLESVRLVKESLDVQFQAVSGVSIDEESISLLNHQRSYQAAARYIGVIDEMLQTLISIG